MSSPQILKDFFKSNNKINFLRLLKNLDFQKSYKKLIQLNSHPAFRNIIFNRLNLPKSYDELGFNSNIFYSENIQGELAWSLVSILNYKNEINTFLDLESQFQKNLLLSNYGLCLEILDTIENNICFSLWTLEHRFSLKQKINENEANWSYLQEINNNTKNPKVLFFAYFFSKKTENGITVFQYRKELQSTIEDLNEINSDYILFKLGNLFKKNFKNKITILNTENNYSIIDKYSIFISILTELTYETSNFNYIRDILDILIENGINDFRINRLREIVNTGDFTVTDLNENILNLYDVYSVGDFKKSIKISRELISQFPENIDLYEIYIKSLLEINEPFVNTFISDFVDDILKSLYSIYCKDSSYLDAKENLLKIYISLNKTSCFKQLFCITTILTNYNFSENINIIYFANSIFSNPQIILLKNLRPIVSFEKKSYENHLSLRINYNIAKNSIKFLELEDIPEYKKSIYKARAELFNSSNPNIEIFLSSYNNNVSSFLREENIVMLYSTYLKLNIYDKLASLIVDSHFENKYFIERIDTIFIIERIIGMNYKLDSINEDLPILFYIEKVESYFMYAILDVFLNYRNMVKPSDIKPSQLNIKIIYILKNICTIDVLNNFYLIFENIDEVIEERIKILKILIKGDSQNSQKYVEEIEEIVKNQKVNKVYKTINDGKISLNFNRIKEDAELNLESNFNRFKKFKNFSDKTELSLINISDLLKSSLNENNNTLLKPQDASFNSFKSLFFEIVDLFLFSKEHGLDGDLSTRIRHGVLENQIRSVFSSNDLIANKGNDNTYNNIIYWDSRFYDKQIEAEISNKIQKAFKIFSNSIDLLISEIITESIQIYSNLHTVKKQGLFNFKFQENLLLVFYNEINEETSYEEFLDNIFEILRLYTLQSLKSTTEFFKETVNQKIQKLIDDLHDQLKIILKNDYRIFQELNNKINKTKTQIEIELHEISKWFKLNDSSKLNLDIGIIVHVSIESINLFNSEKIVPSLTLNVTNQILHGYYYIDIFKILLQNTIKHSGVQLGNLKIDIEVNNELRNVTCDEYDEVSLMTIIIKNNISIKELDVLTKKLSTIKSNWNKDLDFVNVEGGSGFQKIERILRYDLKVLSSDFDFQLDDKFLSIILKITNPFNR